MNAAIALVLLCLGGSAEPAPRPLTSDAVAPDPIVVAVELGGDETLTPTVLRDAIARELRVPVLSPSDEGAPGDAPIMTIALGPGEGVVALKQRGSTLRRSLPLPHDRAGRLRLIAWLAGNLARDQAAGLLGDGRASLLASNDAAGAASGVRARPVNHVTAVSTGAEPIPAVVASAQRPETAPTNDWSVALVTGPEVMNVSEFWKEYGAAGYRDTDLEVTRGTGRWMIGGALGTYGGGSVRAGLLLGWRSSSRLFQPELVTAVGLSSYMHFSVTQAYGDNGTVTTTTTTRAEESWPPGIFLRLSSGVAINVTDWLALVTRVNANAQLTAEILTASVTAGLRCRLP